MQLQHPCSKLDCVDDPTTLHMLTFVDLTPCPAPSSAHLLYPNPPLHRPDAAAGARLLVVASGPSFAVQQCTPYFQAYGRMLFVGEDVVKVMTRGEDWLDDDVSGFHQTAACV
jgi:hypothetical protein